MRYIWISLLLSAAFGSAVRAESEMGHLSPEHISGTWNFVSVCGPDSRLANQRNTGVLRIAHRGDGVYRGRLRNSFGLSGKFTGRVAGRQISGVIDWGLILGEMSLVGQIAEDELRFSGADSENCAVSAVKN